MKNLIGKICILKANSPAIHKMGDIQREYDDLFYIEKDLGDEWKGNFIFGYGFMVDGRFRCYGIDDLFVTGLRITLKAGGRITCI